MVLVRKRRAGSDSLGHVWAHDGDIIDMPYEHAQALLAIADAGFEVIEPEPDPEISESPPPQRKTRSARASEVTETA